MVQSDCIMSVTLCSFHEFLLHAWQHASFAEMPHLFIHNGDNGECWPNHILLRNLKSVLRIRTGNKDNLVIISHISPYKIML